MPNFVLPSNFNPATYMLSKTTEFGVFHETRQAARLAAQLLASGTADDLVGETSDPGLGNNSRTKQSNFAENESGEICGFH